MPPTLLLFRRRDSRQPSFSLPLHFHYYALSPPSLRHADTLLRHWSRQCFAYMPHRAIIIYYTTLIFASGRYHTSLRHYCRNITLLSKRHAFITLISRYIHAAYYVISWRCSLFTSAHYAALAKVTLSPTLYAAAITFEPPRPSSSHADGCLLPTPYSTTRAFPITPFSYRYATCRYSISVWFAAISHLRHCRHYLRHIT